MAANAPLIGRPVHNRNWAPPLRELHNSPTIQPKLEVGKPNDKFEKEADAVADKVMMAPYNRSNRMMMSPNPGSPTQGMMPMPKKNIMMAGNSDKPTLSMNPGVQMMEQPTVQMMENEEEESMVQMVENEEEEPMVQMMENEEEEPMVQMMENEEEEPMVQMMEDEEEEPMVQMMEDEEEQVQMKCGECDQEEKLQQKPAIQKSEDGSTHASPDIAASINSSKGQGSSLHKSTQQELGTKMGADFSGVKVHTDAKAQNMNMELGAKAFTHGSDIYFNKGNYSPDSNEGKHLLAHELTHTIQQSRSLRMSKIQRETDPPNKLVKANKNTTNKVSDAVVEDLAKVVNAVSTLTGQDIGTGFGDTTRSLGRGTAKVGADNFSWHKTGRAIDFNQGLKWVIAEEPSGKTMYFRLYLAATDNDTKSKYAKKITKTDGTKIHHNGLGSKLYKSTLIDVTSILEANGFERIPAHAGWKDSYNKREWWHYEKRDGLNWYQALRQVYTDDTIVTEIKKLISSRHAHGGRLHRNGFPPDILKKLWDNKTIDRGGLSLYFSVGKHRNAPNIPDDMNAMKKAFQIIGNSWQPLSIDPKSVMPIGPDDAQQAPTRQISNLEIRRLTSDSNILYELIMAFQKKNGITPDGYMTIGGGTHKKLGKAVEDALKKKK